MRRVPLAELPVAERRQIKTQLQAKATAYADYSQRAARVIATSHIWVPNPGPQLAAFLSPAEELFYGGSAGGGKSDLILGLAMTMHQRSIIYRREYPQASALIDRLKQLGGSATWNSQKYSWRDPEDEQHIIEIGAIQDAEALEKYRGRPYDLRAYDEATHFYRDWLTFLGTWTRSATGWRTRTVLTGNPPENVDGEFVIDMFSPWLDDNHPNPAMPGELRHFLMWEGREIEVADPLPWATDQFNDKGERLIIWPRSRTFIPARVSDNPDLAGTDYEQALSNLPDELRQKHLEGRFVRVRRDQPNQVIPTAWITLAMERWKANVGQDESIIDQIGIDVGSTGPDPSVIARRSGMRVLPLEVYPGVQDGPDVAGFALDGPWQPETVFAVDVLGPGSSPSDVLKRLEPEVDGKAVSLDVYPVNGSARPNRQRDLTKKLQLTNLRADMYWTLRELLDPSQEGGAVLELPPDVELLKELTAITYTVTIRGIQIEKKSEIKKRLGRSTDRADAVAYACLQKPKNATSNIHVPGANWTNSKRNGGLSIPGAGWR